MVYTMWSNDKSNIMQPASYRIFCGFPQGHSAGLPVLGLKYNKHRCFKVEQGCNRRWMGGAAGSERGAQ